MNGPEHYAEAERLLDFARAVSDSTPGHVVPIGTFDAVLASAQAHATLALAAATVAPRAIGPLEGWGGHHIEILHPHSEKWDEVTR